MKRNLAVIQNQRKEKKKHLFQEWRTIKALLPRILLQMEIPFQSHCADQEESTCRETH